MLENELECEKEVLHVREAELKEIFGDLLLLVYHPLLPHKANISIPTQISEFEPSVFGLFLVLSSSSNSSFEFGHMTS